MSSYGFPKKAEDAAHSSGDEGIMALGVIEYSGAGAVGDYAPLNLNTAGHLKVQVEPTAKATYMAAFNNATLAASCTDFLTITGSGTKTVKVLKIAILPSETSSGAVALPEYLLIKRSTAGSGGTSSTLTNVPLDSASAAGSATVKLFSANPTVGTAIGTISVKHCGGMSTAFNQAVGGHNPEGLMFDYTITGQPIVLRGTSEQVAVNLGGITQPGSSPKMAGYVIWTEES